MSTAPVPGTAPMAPKPLTALQVVERCQAAGLPTLAPVLLREGMLWPALVDARLQTATDIKAACVTARGIGPLVIEADLADRFIAANVSIKHVRAELLRLLAEAQAAQPTMSQHSAPTGQVASASLWKKAVDKTNAAAGL